VDIRQEMPTDPIDDTPAGGVRAYGVVSSVLAKLGGWDRDRGKTDVIRDIVHDYRGLARQRLKEEFPSINAEVETLRLDAFNRRPQ